jgi:hypothetical protein
MREARRHLLEPLDRSLVARPDLLHGRAARSPCAAGRGLGPPGGAARVASRKQRAAAAPLRVPDCSVAFTERSQHLLRHASRPRQSSR